MAVELSQRFDLSELMLGRLAGRLVFLAPTHHLSGGSCKAHLMWELLRDIQKNDRATASCILEELRDPSCEMARISASGNQASALMWQAMLDQALS